MPISYACSMNDVRVFLDRMGGVLNCLFCGGKDSNAGKRGI